GTARFVPAILYIVITSVRDGGVTARGALCAAARQRRYASVAHAPLTGGLGFATVPITQAEREELLKMHPLISVRSQLACPQVS
ncbi:MAG: hypothetical protein ACRDYD_00965, partial [Acidimicrobiales bacterium]